MEREPKLGSGFDSRRLLLMVNFHERNPMPTQPRWGWQPHAMNLLPVPLPEADQTHQEFIDDIRLTFGKVDPTARERVSFDKLMAEIEAEKRKEQHAGFNQNPR